jgi:hypothetical protein
MRASLPYDATWRPMQQCASCATCGRNSRWTCRQPASVQIAPLPSSMPRPEPRKPKRRPKPFGSQVGRYGRRTSRSSAGSTWLARMMPTLHSPPSVCAVGLGAGDSRFASAVAEREEGETGGRPVQLSASVPRTSTTARRRFTRFLVKMMPPSGLASTRGVAS